MIALNNLATVSENETDIENLLLKALHLDSSHTTALFNLGDLYRQQGKCAKSKFYFSLCLAYPDCLPEASSSIGQCSSSTGTGSQYLSEQSRSSDLQQLDTLEQPEKCSNMSKSGHRCSS